MTAVRLVAPSSDPHDPSRCLIRLTKFGHRATRLVQRGVSGFTGGRVDNFADTGDSKKSCMTLVYHSTITPKV